MVTLLVFIDVYDKSVDWQTFTFDPHALMYNFQNQHMIKMRVCKSNVKFSKTTYDKNESVQIQCTICKNNI